MTGIPAVSEKFQNHASEVFGDNYIIVKEECVGHIQKRMGSGLREYKRKKRGIKLTDGKTVGGKGRLTDNMIDRMQNYFGEAIRNNAGDIDAMGTAIWAIYHHIITDDSKHLSEQHVFCPKGPTSWCVFWREPAKYNQNNRLPSVFIPELKPLFTNLTKKDLLQRCLSGLTQNQNESVNGVLWSKCPKTKFCGKSKILLAVSETVTHFNSGSGSRVKLLDSFCSKPKRNMMLAMRKEDDKRVKNAARKIVEQARKRRRKLRSEKKSKKENIVTYQAGSFGLSSNPEDLTTLKPSNKTQHRVSKKRKLIDTAKLVEKTDNLPDLPNETANSTQVTMPEITFVDDKDIEFFIIKS